MPLIRHVRRVLGEQDHVVRECRHCGTTLDPATETCPVCGSEAVARYVIE